MVNKGYPGKFVKNNVIKNLKLIKENKNIKIFHSGTSIDNNNNIVASGGRVLSITTSHKNFYKARNNVYKFLKKVAWKNSFFRKDIGLKAKKLK